MAVPKKRTGHSAQGHRRSNWKATKPEVTKCSNCGEIVLTHTVCTACGYYKGKVVSIKSADYVEAAEAKKPAKKSDTKPAKKAETKVKKQADAVVESEVVSEAVVEEKTEAKTETKAKAKTSKSKETAKETKKADAKPKKTKKTEE